MPQAAPVMAVATACRKPQLPSDIELPPSTTKVCQLTGPCGRGQHHRHACYLVRLAHTAKRRHRDTPCDESCILHPAYCQRRANQARRDGIGPYTLRPPFDGKVAGCLVLTR